MSGTVELMVRIALIVAALIVLTVIAIVGYNYCKIFCIKRLEYKRYFSKEGAYEGEEIYLIEELINHSPLPMLNINVESHVVSQIYLEGCESSDEINQHFVSIFDVGPFTKIKRRHKAICQKRGYYRLETAKVEFGERDLYIDSQAQLYVYPRELEPKLEQEMNMIIKQGEATNLPAMADVFEYAGTRNYAYGDPINRINHKATARAGRIMVNNLQYMMGKRAKLYCNFQMPQDRYQDIDEFKDIMETAMSQAAYIAGQCALKGYLFSYAANSKTVDDRLWVETAEETGMVAYGRVIRDMAMTRIACNCSFGAIIDRDLDKSISGATIYIFTTYMDESIEMRVDALEKLGNSVQICLLFGSERKPMAQYTDNPEYLSR